MCILVSSSPPNLEHALLIKWAGFCMYSHTREDV